MRFWHRLALAIGGCTVEELQGRMSHAEYIRWLAFAQHEPIGSARIDVLNAMQMMLQASINRKKGSRPPKLDQFIPDWWNDKRSPAALAAKFRMLAQSAQGADDTERVSERGYRP